MKPPPPAKASKKSKAQKAHETGEQEHSWASRFVRELEMHASNVAYLHERRRPVLVLSYSDLLWDTPRVARELTAFLPCLGRLDPDFEPTLGVDFFPQTKMKTIRSKTRTSSIMAYGAANQPKSCGFNNSTWRCESWDVAAALPTEIAGRLAGGNRTMAMAHAWRTALNANPALGPRYMRAIAYLKGLGWR